ncbi:hypothetical protein E4U39_007636 [Claviceps sp. Clav50 group G5]|nr:hypothetical protein E4U39_007636 [Claviceps sp. Clav50 group G5]
MSLTSTEKALFKLELIGSRVKTPEFKQIDYKANYRMNFAGFAPVANAELYAETLPGPSYRY